MERQMGPRMEDQMKHKMENQLLLEPPDIDLHIKSIGSIDICNLARVQSYVQSSYLVDATLCTDV